MRSKRIGLVLALCLLGALGACSAQKSRDTQPLSTSVSQPLTQRQFEDLAIVKLADDQIKFLSYEHKVDIEGQDGLFIFAEITNTSEAISYPETVWRTHVVVVEAGSQTGDGVYSAVLTKKELAGSAYKTAIDQLSLPLAPGESSVVGFFYGTAGKEVELVIYGDEFQELERISCKETAGRFIK